jgi:acetylornithine deacetylase/succinyl-diaminopimelate desuccinylase-like protein
MKEAGLENVRMIPSSGHPFVYGEWLHAKGEPTVLFYGHYDVQPADLLNWDSPPFTPTIRNGRIYARGSADNKGQFLAHLCAIKSYLDPIGRLPINVKVLLEGEEENGSPHIEALVESNKELLGANLVYTSDGALHDSDRPTIICGVRGLLYVDLIARGANQDYHSGNLGSFVPNPAWRLVELLNSLRDPKSDRIRIAHFYSGVRPPSPLERSLLAQIPFEQERLNRELGITSLEETGEKAFHRMMFEPSLNICGFHSGPSGPGMVTTVPNSAYLKLDIRLVADQDPDRIWEMLRRAVEEFDPTIDVKRVAAMKPSYTRPDLPIVQLIIGALEEVTESKPVVLPRLGGSLPDYVFTKILGVPSLIVPYANFDQNNHGPNENIKTDLFFRGVRASIQVMSALGGKLDLINNTSPFPPA